MFGRRAGLVALTLALTACVLVVAPGGALGARSDLGQTFGKGETATMSGTVEVPAGDTDGTGSALVRLNPTEGFVCFRIIVQNVDFPLLAAHIHKAPEGVAGPVVVTLSPPVQQGSSNNGAIKGCVTADPTLIRDIMANPAQYYVNVHNKQFPAGVIRGQLQTLSEKAAVTCVTKKKKK
ncbi:MAG TPA: CHRD domain-containing protein [Gaiellaceae bacterium]